MTDPMKWVSSLSTRPSLESAVKEVVEQTQQALQASPNLAFVFISSAFASEYARLMPLLKEQLSVPHIIGCSGGGIVGNNLTQSQNEEIEGKPALSLSLAHLPDVNVRTFHIRSDQLPDLDSSPNSWVELLKVPPEEKPSFILLSDPFSAGINDFLQGLDFAYPGAVKVGGLASGGSITGGSGLFCDGELHRQGSVGVALSGNVVLDSIVAQGCRPIGSVLQVVECERNILLKLKDQSSDTVDTPLNAIHEILQTLSEDDRELAQHSLFIGLAQSEFKQTLDPGDFLIRNLLGVDPRVGAIAIGDRVRPGQRIQFHLRDARASFEDLETLLKRYQLHHQTGEISPAGALMFSCLGRGESLYGHPNVDSRLFSQYVNAIPLSGFFCNGEIGPVGGTTLLHGYTSVFGICRPLA